MLAQAAGAAEPGALAERELLAAEAFVELQIFKGIVQRFARMLEEAVFANHRIAASLDEKLLGLRSQARNDDDNPALH